MALFSKSKEQRTESWGQGSLCSRHRRGHSPLRQGEEAWGPHPAAAFCYRWPENEGLC